MLKRGQATREQLAELRPDLDPENETAVMLWNAMGGKIDWAALPLLFGLHRVADPETMIERLLVLQDEMGREPG
ncbi:MAG: hypothetical protein IT579_25140 [Verrucomicrobia subdivision 3 bacterium]|nr:hypothetical protein [Limisphaerales bacterium]